MRKREFDPLYSLFEQHLLTAMVEDESTDDLIYRVVTAYIAHLKSGGTMIAPGHSANLESDLKEEVLEMFRKKTYGHFNLASYRKAHGVEAPVSQPRDQADRLLADQTDQKEKARRGGRAC